MTRLQKIKMTLFFAFLLSFALAAGVGPFNAAAETISVDLKLLQQSAGIRHFSVVYRFEGTEPFTTGLGIRIHYNSNAVSKAVFTDIFQEGLVVKDMTPKPDAADYDRNPETDRFIVLAWMDIDGRWPGNAGPSLTLATLSTTLNPGGEAPQLAVTASSVPAGLDFKGGRVAN